MKSAVILIFSLSYCLWASAVEPPEGSVPLEDIENISDNDKLLPEPDISIRKEGSTTIEEYRINGELYLKKITPVFGPSYYLFREDQYGGWSRIDDGRSPLVIPKWVIMEW